MRVAIANTTSAFVHVAALTGMAYWTLDSWQPSFQFSAGQSVTVQFTPASASSEPERIVELEVSPLELVEPVKVVHEAQQVEITRQSQTPATRVETPSPEPLPELPRIDTTEAVVKVDVEPPPNRPQEEPETPSETRPTAKPPESQVAAVQQEFQSAEVAGVADQLPHPVTQTLPAYPLDALRAGVFGRSTLILARVAADGTVLTASVDRSSGWPSMDAEALQAIRRWRFNPARREGIPVEYDFRVWFDFTPPRS